MKLEDVNSDTKSGPVLTVHIASKIHLTHCIILLLRMREKATWIWCVKTGCEYTETNIMDQY